jgi:hypothetical protein
VLPKTILCSICGLDATPADVEGKPTLVMDPTAFETFCTETSEAPEPF